MEQDTLQILYKEDFSVLLTKEKPWFSLIWLHGLGDTTKGFKAYFQEQMSPVFKGARVILLQAPNRAVTVNKGISFPSWFDYITMKVEEGKDQENYGMAQVQDSLEIVHNHITEELQYWKEQGIKGDEEILCKRIFIGGLSQGCALSLCYALTSQRLLAGVIGLSGHLFDNLSMKNKENLQILVCHGTEDKVFKAEDVKKIYDKHLGGLPNFTFKLIKDLYHEVTLQQLTLITEWMLEQLKKTGITSF